MKVRSRDGIRVQFIGKSGQVLTTVNSASAEYTLDANGLYIRAVVTNSAGKIAYTQAYYPPPAPGIGVVPRSATGANILEQANQHVIRYSVKGDAARLVKLEIHDLLGRKIRTLANALLLPGNYEMPWDERDDYGRRQANGVYVFTLGIDGKMKHGRIVVR